MDSSVRVLVRFRPLLSGEVCCGSTDYCVDEGGVKLRVNRASQKMSQKGQLLDSQEYHFNKILESSAGDEETYESVGPGLLAALGQNRSASLILYGQTGSGKTFTMASISQRLVAEMFVTASQCFVNPSIEIGVAQVYVDNAYDLLSASARNPRGTPIERSLRTIPTHSVVTAEQASALIIQAEMYRAKAPHNLNKFSSRSHSIVLIRVKHVRGEARMFLVDLAGSERVEKTKTTGETFREGLAVNQSLLALSRCVQSMASGGDYVPVRESTLTLFLAESFAAGNALTLVCTVSPANISESETRNTLNFADVAKKVRLLRHNAPPAAVSSQASGAVAALEEALRALENRHAESMREMLEQKTGLQKEVKHLRQQLDLLSFKHSEEEGIWREDVRFLEEKVCESTSQEEHWRRRGEELAADIVRKSSADGHAKQVIEQLVMENVELRRSLDAKHDELESLVLERQMHLARIENMWNEIMLLSSTSKEFDPLPTDVESPQTEASAPTGPTAIVSCTTDGSRHERCLQLITERAEADKVELRATIARLEEQLSQFLYLGATPRMDNTFSTLSARRARWTSEGSQTIETSLEWDDVLIKNELLTAKVLELELEIAAQPGAESVEFDAYMGMLQTVAQLRLENEELKQSLGYAVRETDLALARHQQLLGVIRSRNESKVPVDHHHSALAENLSTLRDQLSKRSPSIVDLVQLHESIHLQLSSEEALARAAAKSSFLSRILIVQHRENAAQTLAQQLERNAHEYRVNRLATIVDDVLGSGAAEELLQLSVDVGPNTNVVSCVLEKQRRLQDELARMTVQTESFRDDECLFTHLAQRHDNMSSQLFQSYVTLLYEVEEARRFALHLQEDGAFDRLVTSCRVPSVPFTLSPRHQYVNDRLVGTGVAVEQATSRYSNADDTARSPEAFTMLLRQLEETRSENIALQQALEARGPVAPSVATQAERRDGSAPIDDGHEHVIEALRLRIEELSAPDASRTTSGSEKPTSIKERDTVIEALRHQIETMSAARDMRRSEDETGGQQHVIEELRRRIEQQARAPSSRVAGARGASLASGDHERDDVIEGLRERIESMSASHRSASSGQAPEAFTMLLRQLEETRSENIALQQALEARGPVAPSVATQAERRDGSAPIDDGHEHVIEALRLRIKELECCLTEREIQGRVVFRVERNDFVPPPMECETVSLSEDPVPFEQSIDCGSALFHDELLDRRTIELECQASVWRNEQECLLGMYNISMEDVRVRELRVAALESSLSYRMNRLGACMSPSDALLRPSPVADAGSSLHRFVQQELFQRELLSCSESEERSSFIVAPFCTKMVRYLHSRERHLEELRQVAQYHIDRLSGETEVHSWAQLQSKTAEVTDLNCFMSSAAHSMENLRKRLSTAESTLALYNEIVSKGLPQESANSEDSPLDQLTRTLNHHRTTAAELDDLKLVNEQLRSRIESFVQRPGAETFEQQELLRSNAEELQELRDVNEQLRLRLETASDATAGDSTGVAAPGAATAPSGDAAGGDMFQKMLVQLEEARAEKFALQRRVDELQDGAPVAAPHAVTVSRERADNAGAPREPHPEPPEAEVISSGNDAASSRDGHVDAVVRQNAVLQREIDDLRQQLLDAEGLRDVNEHLRQKLGGLAEVSKEASLRELNSRLLKEIRDLRAHATEASDPTEGGAPSTVDMVIRQLEAERAESFEQQELLRSNAEELQELRDVNEQLRLRLETASDATAGDSTGVAAPGAATAPSGDAAGGDMFQKMLVQLEEARAEKFALQRRVDELQDGAPVAAPHAVTVSRERADNAGAPREPHPEPPEAEVISSGNDAASSRDGHVDAVVRQNAVLQREIDDLRTELSESLLSRGVVEQLRQKITSLRDDIEKLEAQNSQMVAMRDAATTRSEQLIQLNRGLADRCASHEARVTVLEDALAASEAEKCKKPDDDLKDQMLQNVIKQLESSRSDFFALQSSMERDTSDASTQTEVALMYERLSEVFGSEKQALTQRMQELTLALHRSESKIRAQEAQYQELVDAGIPSRIDEMQRCIDESNARCSAFETQCSALQALADKQSTEPVVQPSKIASLQAMVHRLQEELIQARSQQLATNRSTLKSSFDGVTSDHAGLMRVQEELQDNIETLKIQNYEILQELNDPTVRYELHKTLDCVRRENLRLKRAIQTWNPTFEVQELAMAPQFDVAVDATEGYPAIEQLESRIANLRERVESAEAARSEALVLQRSASRELHQANSRLSDIMEELREAQATAATAREDTRSGMLDEDIAKIRVWRRQAADLEAARAELHRCRSELREQSSRDAELNLKDQQIVALTLEGDKQRRIIASLEESYAMSIQRVEELELINAQERGQLSGQRDALQKLLQSRDDSIAELNKELGESSRRIAVLESANRRVQQLEGAIKEAHETIEDLTSAAPSRQVPGRTQLEIDSVARISDLEAHVEQLSIERRSLDRALQDAITDAQSAAHERESLRASVVSLSEKVSRHNADVLPQKEIKRLEEECASLKACEKTLRQALVDAQAESRQYYQRVEELRSELSDSTVVNEELRHQLKALATSQAQLTQDRRKTEATPPDNSVALLSIATTVIIDGIDSIGVLGKEYLHCRSDYMQRSAELFQLLLSTHGALTRAQRNITEIGREKMKLASDLFKSQMEISQLQDGKKILERQLLDSSHTADQSPQPLARDFEELRKQHAVLRQRMEELQADLLKKESVISSLGEQLASSAAPKDESDALQVVALRARVKELDKKNRALGVALQRDKEKVESLQFQADKMTKLFFENRKVVHDQAIILQRNQQKMGQMQLLLHSAGVAEDIEPLKTPPSTR